MSNLKLPNLSYESLLSALSRTPDGFKNIAYHTTAAAVNAYNPEDVNYDDGDIEIIIRHNGNVIARMDSEGWVFVSNRGWGSPTTRQRINAVLYDNGIPFSVVQRNFVQVLFTENLRFSDFYSAMFNNGTIDSFNMEKV